MRKRKEQGFFTKKNMIGIFIALIMIMSGIGYMATQDQGPSAADYNGYRFQSQNYGEWYAKIGEKQVRFTYHPTEIENLNVSPEVIGYLLNTKMIYIAFDPADEGVQEIELARMELERELPDYFGIFPVTGVTNATQAYAGFQQMDCANATLFVPMLLFRTSDRAEAPAISSEGACIIIEAASPRDIPALKDRLLYGLFRIME